MTLQQRARIWVIKVACKALMPENIWVSNYWGVYTQKAGVTFGKIDGRGVLQGVLEKDVFNG